MAIDETGDIQAADIWGVECSYQGLNPNCLKCDGWGRIRSGKDDRDELTERLARNLTIVRSAKKERAVKNEVKTSTVSASSQSISKVPKMNVPKKGTVQTKPRENSADLENTFPKDKPFFCTKCKLYLKPPELFDHRQHKEHLTQRKRK